MAKDFTGIKANEKSKVKSTIAEATADKEKRKERKTYNDEEAKEYLQEMKTTGRKGLKLPRMNVAFSPDIYEYCKTMARAAGMTYTDFVNNVLRLHMEAHKDKYEETKKFREDLF